MTQRLRRVARLQRAVQPYLARLERHRAEENERAKKICFERLAIVTLLALYGQPKIDESLEAAWQRVLESPAWKAYRQKYPALGPYHTDDWVTPFQGPCSRFIAEYFRKYVLPDLPGEDEPAKFAAIFATVPPWLLWYTHADCCALLVGIKLPDLSCVSRFDRGGLSALIPMGPFECRRLPKGVYDRFTERGHKQHLARLSANMTARERKRALRLVGRANDVGAPHRTAPTRRST